MLNEIIVNVSSLEEKNDIAPFKKKV